MQLRTSIFFGFKTFSKDLLSFNLAEKKAYLLNDKFFGVIDLQGALFDEPGDILPAPFAVSAEYFLPLCARYPEGVEVTSKEGKIFFSHKKDKIKLPLFDSAVDAALAETLNNLLSPPGEEFLIFDLSPYASICKDAAKYGQTGILIDPRGIAARSPAKVYVYRFESEYLNCPGADKVNEFFLPLEFVPFLDIAKRVVACVSPGGEILLTLHHDENQKPFAAFLLASIVEKDDRVAAAANFALHDYNNYFVCDDLILREFVQLCKPALGNKDQVIPMEIVVTGGTGRIKLLSPEQGLDFDIDLSLIDSSLADGESRVLRFSAVQFEKVISPLVGQVKIGFYNEDDRKKHVIITPCDIPRKFIFLSQVIKRG